MTESEIINIENDLDIKLPSHYISFIKNFQGFQSNDLFLDDFIYINSDRLIQINKLLGFYRTDKFIKKKLCVGENGGGDFYLIDLDNFENTKVYFLDHEESAEMFYDESTETWKWDDLESYDTLNDFKNDIIEDFGI